MAKVIKIKSELRSDKNKALLYTALTMAFSILFFAAGAALLIALYLKKTEVSAALPIALLCISLLLLMVFLAFRKRHGILKSGVDGEKAVFNILKKLPSGYTVITNPVICNRGSINELDFAAIGKNGVFIIEAKNYRGIIKGKTSAQNWRQIKHGKNDRIYEKEVKNPVKQAHRQGRRMLEVFSDFDITADVFPIVYFADSKSELKITDDADLNIPIFNDEKSLLDYIIKSKGRHTVTSSELNKIIRFFKK